MPAEYIAESLVAAFTTTDLLSKRVLIPRAAIARDVIPVELSELGAEVDVVEAYRNVIPAHIARIPKPEWITFTSSSTVKNYIEIAGRESLDGVRIASIGPITSGTARGLGLTVDVEAEPYTIDGLVAAIVQGCL
jgi:uroporphyrinogen-III synthase